jgi:hypothetical protein
MTSNPIAVDDVCAVPVSAIAVADPVVQFFPQTVIQDGRVKFWTVCTKTTLPVPVPVPACVEGTAATGNGDADVITRFPEGNPVDVAVHVTAKPPRMPMVPPNWRGPGVITAEKRLAGLEITVRVRVPLGGKLVEASGATTPAPGPPPEENWPRPFETSLVVITVSRDGGRKAGLIVEPPIAVNCPGSSLNAPPTGTAGSPIPVVPVVTALPKPPSMVLDGSMGPLSGNADGVHGQDRGAVTAVVGPGFTLPNCNIRSVPFT